MYCCYCGYSVAHHCCYLNFRVSGAHGIASAAKRSALKNFTNSRIVSGLLKGNRLPDVQQLQKSMKLLKVSINMLRQRLYDGGRHLLGVGFVL